MKIILATIKSWNVENALSFQDKYKDKHQVHIIRSREELTYENIRQINPDYIFFPHWSWIIPQSLYENYQCIVFHMTDLPFGRGGSPLQNLIDAGVENTVISAIKVVEGIDAGDIYLKECLNLNGTADEILMRASSIIFDHMIPQILAGNLTPHPQQGEVVQFKRRTAEQGQLQGNFDLKKIYDYIRMLDGEDYPKAFIKFGKYKLVFSRASLKEHKIIADVEILEEGD